MLTCLRVCSRSSRSFEKPLLQKLQVWFGSPEGAAWRLRWSFSLVLLAKRLPQVGQATTLSAVWTRVWSESLLRSRQLCEQPKEVEEEGRGE